MWIGLAMQLFLFCAVVVLVVTRSYIVLDAWLLAFCADFGRYIWNKSTTEYVLTRVASPWIVLYGILRPEIERPQYTVEEVTGQRGATKTKEG
jgi:hypothetical protein